MPARDCNQLYTTAEGLEQLRKEHEATFGDAACPQWVKDSLERFTSEGIPTGDFLRAVLANDLQGAFARADIDTARTMAAIVGYVYRHVPCSLMGSYDVVDRAVQRGLAVKRAESQR